MEQLSNGRPLSHSLEHQRSCTMPPESGSFRDLPAYRTAAKEHLRKAVRQSNRLLAQAETARRALGLLSGAARRPDTTIEEVFFNVSKIDDAGSNAADVRLHGTRGG